MGVCVSTKVPMFPKTHKVWGYTQSVAVTDRPTHTALAFLKRGGYSSRHYHKDHFNRFIVVTGCLQISIWRDGRLETLDVKPWEAIDVEPEIWHKMMAWQDTNLIEIYWPKDGCDLNVEDIVRENSGGVTSITPETHCYVPSMGTMAF